MNHDGLSLTCEKLAESKAKNSDLEKEVRRLKKMLHGKPHSDKTSLIERLAKDCVKLNRPD